MVAKKAWVPPIDEYNSISNDNHTFGRNLMKSEAAGRNFLNDEPNIHVRSEYTKDDYYYFRKSERVQKDSKRAIQMCQNAYENIGIIKNTIDLMTDFGCKGIRIVHKNKKIQGFLRQFFKFVNGKEVSQKILKALYRDGNLVIERFDGSITKKAQDRWKSIGFLAQDVKPFNIPRQYIIHNILSVEKFGDSVITERPIFAMRLSTETLNDIAYFGNKDIQLALKPEYSNVKAGELVQLDKDRIYDYYYKKDDYDKWARPMTYAIMNELLMLDKVELADMSALDGVISNVRLWRLGSFEHGIYPNRDGIQKLRNILAKNVGGGVLDLVWGPELDFKESNTQVHHFLGKEKYEAILTLIYAGLGIPPTLTGSSTASGMTNNFISIKTLVERLQYGRDILIDFWEKQLDLVCRAMGFIGSPRVLFTYNVLSDEAAEKALLVDLVDRDLISAESVRDAFGFDPEIEQIKVNRESRRRGTTTPNKASPYHNPLKDHEIEKLFVGSQAYPPSQFGVKVDPAFDKAPSELNSKFKPVKDKQFTGKDPEGGRPFNAKDKVPRKTKKINPAKGFANKLVWYEKAKEKVDAIINPVYLKAAGKENLRFLTKDEYLILERVKFYALSNLEIFKDFTEKDVISVLNISGKAEAIENYSILLEEFKIRNEKNPTVEQTKQLYSIALSLSDLEQSCPGKQQLQESQQS